MVEASKMQGCGQVWLEWSPISPRCRHQCRQDAQEMLPETKVANRLRPELQQGQFYLGSNVNTTHQFGPNKGPTPHQHRMRFVRQVLPGV
jgi:hypothetical protein